MCLMHLQTTKAQISAFVVRCQVRMTLLVCISEISRFYLVTVAEQVSLCLAWSETPEDTFCHGVAHLYSIFVESYC